MADIDVSKIISEIGEPRARFIESEEDKRQRTLMYIFSFVFLFIFIIGLVVFFVLGRYAKAQESVLSSEVSQLNEENAELLSVEREAFSVRKRNQSALELIKNNANWSYVFTELEKLSPKTIFFSKFEVDEVDSLKITAISPDYETASKLMVALGESDMFSGVGLNTSSLNLKETGAEVEFTLQLSLTKDITRESFNPLVAPEEGGLGQEEESEEESVQIELPLTEEGSMEGEAGEGGEAEEENGTSEEAENQLPVL